MSLLIDYLPAGPLVLDASAVFNILGCGQTRKVFETLRGPCLLEERTRKEIKRHPIPGLCHNGVLEELEAAGLVRFERMTADEYEMYLSLVQGALSTRLGEGESAAIAVASSRRHVIVLDDNKARDIYRQRFGNDACVSSLKLFLSVAHRGTWSVADLQEVIDTAGKNARMAVPKDERGLVEKLYCIGSGKH